MRTPTSQKKADLISQVSVRANWLDRVRRSLAREITDKWESCLVAVTTLPDNAVDRTPGNGGSAQVTS